MTEPIHLAAVERLYTMSDQDRRCPGCGWPLNAQRGAPCRCPACGQPTTDADNIDRATARALRREAGLVP